MNWRKMTSLIVAWSFIALVISGVVLYIVPHGRVAYWTDWSLWGLIKDSWAEIHIVFGAIFIVMGIIHIFYNWKPLKKYMVERAKGHMHLRKELVLATVISVSVLIGSIANLPPVSWLFDLNATIKQAWLSSPDFEPPYGHAEETSLAGFSRRMGMDINKISKEISDSKITLRNIQDDITKNKERNEELEQKIKENTLFFSDSKNQEKKIDEELEQRRKELEVLKKRLVEMKKTGIRNQEDDDSKSVVEAASQIVATTNKRLQDTMKELDVIRELLDKERKAHTETKKKLQN